MAALLAAGLLFASTAAFAAPFAPGNIVVYRVGNGAAALTNAGTAAFLDEYTATGTLVQSIALPTAVAGVNRECVAAGTSTSEGLLTRSTDNRFLVGACYAAAPGTASIAGTTSAATNRVVFRVGTDGVVDTSTALSDFASAGNPRGAASTNGIDLWFTGSTGGVRYAPFGSTTSTQLSTTVTNLRNVYIAGGQLHVSTSSGSAVRIGTVGTGTPTTAGQVITPLPGIPTSTGSPYSLVLLDLTDAVAGNDTLYVADDTANQILKYALVGGSWLANGTVTASGVRGLTASVAAGTVTLYASSATALLTLTDSSGYNATLTGTPTSIATAPTNTAFRGVAFAPVAASVTPSISINDVTVAEGNGGTTTATFTVSLSSPAGVGGVTFDIATADNTATTADGDYVSRALTAQAIAEGASTFAFDVTVNGDVAIEPTETFFVNVTNVTGATVADGQGQGTITNDDAVVPVLSIAAPAPTAEGNSGCAGSSTPFVFTVSASVAPASDLAFNWTTLDGTAQDGTPAGEDNDYAGVAAGGGTITGGSTSTTVTVQVACDDTFEPNETFSAVLGAGAGYTIGTGSAQATIANDDVARIGAVQGAGAASPLLGQVVAVRGIVTSRVNNGFYLQSQAADADADPNTSEGLFVFTSSVPSAAATVGNLVTVTGTVAEFVPATDPNQQPLTQLTTPTVVVVSSGNPLPAPVDLTPVLPSTTGGVEQLENLENMRVRVPTLRVVAPTDGNVSEPNATATTNGRFYGVIPDNARPFREPGLEVEDAAGQPSTIPRWDNNPEKINIESSRARNPANTLRPSIDVDVGATLSEVVGVIDYAFRNHRLTLDFDAAPTVAGGRAPAAVSVSTAAEVTVAAYNLERFFDDVNDPAIGEPVLTAQAFQNRLAKASIGIREFLRAPDILGVVEVENLATLQALATRINNDAVAANQPNPQYVARLVEGNDVGGIDVGFLVKTAPVAGSTPRVAINGAVEQLGAAEPLRCPDNSPVVGELLNDRPSLLLNATVAAPNGATAPVTVIVNHLRSLGDVNSTAPAIGNAACFGTTGNRVRAKRLQQAVFLANAIQARQTGSPNQNIVLVGDFNAFEFNDGFVDSMGVIAGAPAPDNETVVPGDGVDLVTPDFVNLGVSPSAPADERYSFVFSGNAQNLDHVLVSGALAKAATGLRLEHARINADFGEDNRNDPAIPVRLSDHDPLVAFIGLPGFGLPDAVFANGFEPLAGGAD